MQGKWLTLVWHMCKGQENSVFIFIKLLEGGSSLQGGLLDGGRYFHCIHSCTLGIMKHMNVLPIKNK